MAQKCTVGGVAYEIKGGRTLVGGVGYAVVKGRTLVDGVGYDVSFAPAAALPTFDGSCNFYGDATQGWVELLEDGTLTFPNTANLASCDVYLLENGEAGIANFPLVVAGGKGGDHAEMYRLDLRGMEVAVTIGEVTKFPLSDGTIYDTADAANGGAGGTKNTHASADGYAPFGGTLEAIDALGSKKLGAGGGYPGYAGGQYGGGAGGKTIPGGNTNGEAGLANTGSGGGGAMYGNPGVGGTGIVIVRWGYETA